MSGGAHLTLPYRPVQKQVSGSAVVRVAHCEACPGRGIRCSHWECFSRQRLSYVYLAFQSDRASFAFWCPSF